MILSSPAELSSGKVTLPFPSSASVRWEESHFYRWVGQQILRFNAKANHPTDDQLAFWVVWFPWLTGWVDWSDRDKSQTEVLPG
jgi:hypothetical protein